MKKNRKLNDELRKYNNEKIELINKRKEINGDEIRLKKIEKELNKKTTINAFDKEVFKKFVKKKL